MQIKKTLGILLAVFFVLSVTAATVSAHEGRMSGAISHGNRYAPDHGNRYAPDHGNRYAPDHGNRYAPNQRQNTGNHYSNVNIAQSTQVTVNVNGNDNNVNVYVYNYATGSVVNN
jgi:hypothetical protein